MSTKRIRHDQHHWQRLIEKHARSGLSGAQFCRQQHIAYASFMAWRKRLQAVTPPPASAPQSTFVELTAPAAIPETVPTQTESRQPGMCVELTLGAGIELRITRNA